ncbi:MAG: Na-translocating system protein MpsC family protein [Pirellulaceae bacterium]
MTAAKQHLVKTLPSEKGRNLLKQVRTQLIETTRPTLEALIRDITGVKPLSMHHDISTLTGELVVLFTLAEVPRFREVEKK